MCIALDVFRGLGDNTLKSLPLFPESAQPPLARTAAVELLVAGTGPVPEKQFAVVP